MSDVDLRGIGEPSEPEPISSYIAGKLDPNELLRDAVSSPLVVLFGPPQVGKTSLLARLIKYTSTISNPLDWRVVPEPVLMDPSTEAQYQTKCSKLLADICNHKKFIGSTEDLYVFATKRDGGKYYCTVLEAPGEHYYSESDKQFLRFAYLANLANDNRKKIYIFIFFPGLYKQNNGLKEDYDTKVASFIREKIEPGRDKFVLVLNKVDTSEEYKQGHDNQHILEAAFGEKGFFPRTGKAFSNSSIKDKERFVMQTGEFRRDGTSETVAWSPDKYPKALFDHLHVLIKGRSWWQFWI